MSADDHVQDAIPRTFATCAFLFLYTPYYAMQTSVR
jgi:hypothetical protein